MVLVGCKAMNAQGIEGEEESVMAEAGCLPMIFLPST